MNDNRRLAALLLLATSLTGVPALAQGQSPDPVPTAPPAGGPVVFDDEEQQEPDIVGPGAGAIDADEIVVTGRNIPNYVKAAPSVISVLSQEDIARTGDGEIAGALARVTGLSLVGGKFVYVRGLGDRYSSALMNGLPLPSPEPLKRVVPLDLFPSTVIASATIQKSFIPSYPGEFGGGVINLTTLGVPTERFVNIGGSFGGNTMTTGNLGYTYWGSSTDWTGFDRGVRDLPSLLQSANNQGKRLEVGGDYPLRYVQDATAQLLNASTNLIQRNNNVPADLSAGIQAGNAWEVGEGELGMVVSLEWSQEWQTQSGTQQSAFGASINPDGEEVLVADQSYLFTSTQMRAQFNGLLGFSYDWDEHNVRFTNLFIRDSLKEARILDGIDTVNVAEDDPINRNYTGWFQRQLYTGQLVGEFKFDRLSVNVRGAYANTSRDAPYERLNSYRYSPIIDDYFNDLTTNGARSTIAFSNVNDTLWAANLDVGYELNTKRPIVVSAGYAFSDNTRNALRLDYRYVTAGGEALPFDVAQQRPDYLLSDYNIYTYDVVLRETSGADGAAAYDAGLRVNGFYGQVDAEVVDYVKVTAGLRYESGDQFVDTLDIFDNDAVVGETTISKNYWLPAGVVTWNFREDMQLRFAASKTIARPQFRELAPQPYTDPDNDRTYVGNPYLIDSQLTNIEGRYEWYFDSEQKVTIGIFGKWIKNPIEAITFGQGGTIQTTFANAPAATLYGIEAEFNKWFDLPGKLGERLPDRRLLFAPNVTWTQSSISVQDGDTTINNQGQVVPASDIFIDGLPLIGQSDWLFNLQLGLSANEKLSQQTFLIGYASDRATQRGPAGTPDYVEKPGWILDFVWREAVTLGKIPVTLSFEARNLLNTKYSETQTLNDSTIDILVYRYGVSFQAGATFSF
jgi:outer membrane receptor protein involved in Fe transport